MRNTEPIHFSEISTWLRCNYLHQLNYIEEIVPRRTAKEIAFGTLGHAAMKTLILGGSSEDAEASVKVEIKKHFENDVIGSETKDVIAIGYEALAVANRIWPRVRDKFRYKNHLVEETLQMVVDDILFQGTPDWVAEDNTGIWVIDHKFRKTFRPFKSEMVNLQMAFYQGLVLNSRGIHTQGSRQLQIKPLLPKEPEIIKSGRVSTKDIMTDWETYAKFVESCGQNPDDYLEMKDKLNKHVWFDIDETKVSRTTDEISNCWNRIILPAAKSILLAKESGEESVRCMNWSNCKNCSMFEYCTESLKDGDTEFLLKTNYKRKSEASFVEVQFIEGTEE